MSVFLLLFFQGRGVLIDQEVACRHHLQRVGRGEDLGIHVYVQRRDGQKGVVFGEEGWGRW